MYHTNKRCNNSGSWCEENNNPTPSLQYFCKSKTVLKNRTVLEIEIEMLSINDNNKVYISE